MTLPPQRPQHLPGLVRRQRLAQRTVRAEHDGVGGEQVGVVTCDHRQASIGLAPGDQLHRQVGAHPRHHLLLDLRPDHDEPQPQPHQELASTLRPRGEN